MYDINFITREDLKEHIKNTIATYDQTLNGIDLKKFNTNIIDPIKMVFDSKVYRKNFEDVIEAELVRQRDRTNVNAIGYFHQNIFKYIKNCTVPEKGFDVIFQKSNSEIIYVEMKNKHNTMNSTTSQKTYTRMLNKIANDKNAICFLVEAIAKHSQNIVWKVKVDNENIENDRIRRVSIDKFYEIVSGDKDAFYKLCMLLPEFIEEIINENKELQVGVDTVVGELKERNPDLLKALYLLAFKEYNGFEYLR